MAATRSHRVESVAAFCKFNSCLVMLCTPIIRLLHSGQVHARAILLVLLKTPRQFFKKSTPGFLKITPPGIRQRPQHLRHSRETCWCLGVSRDLCCFKLLVCVPGVACVCCLCLLLYVDMFHVGRKESSPTWCRKNWRDVLRSRSLREDCR